MSDSDKSTVGRLNLKQESKKPAPLDAVNFGKMIGQRHALSMMAG